jgi:Fe-S-cluster containining protein
MIEHSPVARCLSFHASYRCRSTGACCSAGWTIPFSGGELSDARRLPLTRAAFVPLPDGGAAAGVRGDGACTFLEDGTGLCEIHRLGGHASLPLTCRMFPRLVLHDSRATSVSLSHFCPTAAAMLFEPGPPAAIVDAPDALTGAEPLDGLDARDAWPPLLRSGVLTDLESYDTWERRGIEILTREGIAPRDSLAALDTATSRIVRWAPGGRPLLHEVQDAFAALAPPTSELEPRDAAIKRWLAARLFGTWIAYQGEGLRTIVRYVRACFDAFQLELARDGNPLEAIRRSDRLIVHDALSQRLATLLNDCP